MSAEAWGSLVILVISVAVVVCMTYAEHRQCVRDKPHVAQPRPDWADSLTDDDRKWLQSQLDLAGAPQQAWLALDLKAAAQRLVAKAREERTRKLHRDLQKLNQDLRAQKF